MERERGEERDMRERERDSGLSLFVCFDIPTFYFICLIMAYTI